MINMSDLIPVEAYDRVLPDKSSYGKVIKVSALKAKNGTMVCSGLPAHWLNYIKEAINTHYKKEAYRVKQQSKVNPVIATFNLPGQPMAKTDSKVVGYNADGAMVIEPNKEYNSYIIQLKKKQHIIIKGKTELIPIETAVIVECIYYIKRINNTRYNIADLLSTTLDVLVQLHILKSSKDNIVIGVGETKICYTKEEPETVVTIRRPAEVKAK